MTFAPIEECPRLQQATNHTAQSAHQIATNAQDAKEAAGGKIRYLGLHTIDMQSMQT
jgi:hypothetical protein